jgi:hypothetical protein
MLMFIPRADRLRNLARKAESMKAEKDPKGFEAAMEGLYGLANEIEGLEGQGTLLDIVARRAYAVDSISKRAYIMRVPSLWFNRTLLGLEEDLPLMPIEGFAGKPFVAMSVDDYRNRLKMTYDKFRVSYDDYASENKIPLLNEIAGLITDATWDLIRHDDVAADGRLLRAQSKLNGLLDKEEPEK